MLSMATKRQSAQHGRYVMHAMKYGNRWRARAFVGRVPVMDAEGTSEQDAFAKLQRALDERAATLHDARQDGIPVAEEYREALALLWDALSERQRQMLVAHAQAPEGRLTATELAGAAGYTKHETASLKYAEVARLMAEMLAIPAERRDGGGDRPVTPIAAAEERDEQGHWRWIMHEPLIDAMRQLGHI